MSYIYICFMHIHLYIDSLEGGYHIMTLVSMQSVERCLGSVEFWACRHARRIAQGLVESLDSYISGGSS